MHELVGILTVPHLSQNQQVHISDLFYVYIPHPYTLLQVKVLQSKLY